MAFVIVLAATLTSLGSGCGTKRRGGALVNPGISYLPATSPQSVLANLVYAYMVRDSAETALVYDDAYQGTSIDLSDPSPDLHFTKADEVRHVGRLKLDPDIISVYVDLGNAANWQRMSPDASDPPDYAVIQINSNRVEIQDVRTGTAYSARNTPMVYTFKPTVSAPGDTTWKIVRWTEVAN
jgi:hypothetical protein